MHTPGPWHVADGIYGKSVCGPMQTGMTGGTVAPCICKGPGVNWEGNARLIAAAPELLEACKLAVSVIGEGVSDLWWSRIANLEVNLKNVIAKAEGKP